jgi:hypothetical protein
LNMRPPFMQTPTLALESMAFVSDLLVVFRELFPLPLEIGTLFASVGAWSCEYLGIRSEQ